MSNNAITESQELLPKIRYNMLDEARGFAVLCMVFYHAFYTLAYEEGLALGMALLNFFMPAEPFFAMFFICLSGVASQLTRSNLKRGIKLLIISAVISAVTISLPYFGITECEIYFGILHLLATGMLLVALINPLLKKLNPMFMAVIFLLIFVLTYNIELGYLGLGQLKITLPKTLYETNSLFFLGFHNNEFYSADYFSIIPWIFMFLCGAALGLYAPRGKFPKFLIKKRVPPFGFIGRHALIIYILHQPVIYGITMIADLIINAF